MASPSQKRARLQLRSRGRDEVLQQLQKEIHNQEKHIRHDMKRKGKKQAEVRAELDNAQNSASRVTITIGAADVPQMPAELRRRAKRGDDDINIVT